MLTESETESVKSGTENVCLTPSAERQLETLNFSQMYVQIFNSQTVIQPYIVAIMKIRFKNTRLIFWFLSDLFHFSIHFLKSSKLLIMTQGVLGSLTLYQGLCCTVVKAALNDQGLAIYLIIGYHYFYWKLHHYSKQSASSFFLKKQHKIVRFEDFNSVFSI